MDNQKFEILLKATLDQATGDIKTQINQLGKKLADNPIKLSVEFTDIIKSIDTTIKEINKRFETLHIDLGKQINVNGAKTQIEQVTKSLNNMSNTKVNSKQVIDLERHLKEIQATTDKLASVKISTDAMKNPIKAVISYTDNMGKAIAETYKLKELSDGKTGWKLDTSSLTNGIKQLETLEQRLKAFKTTQSQSLGNIQYNAGNSNLLDAETLQRINNLKKQIANTSIENMQDKAYLTTLNSMKLEIENIISAKKQSIKAEQQEMSYLQEKARLEKQITIATNNANSLAGSKYNKYADMTSLNSLISQLNKLKITGSEDVNSIKLKLTELDKEFLKLQQDAKIKFDTNAVKMTFDKTETVLGRMMTSFNKFSSWFLVGGAFMAVVNGVKSAVESVNELNQTFTELSLVMNNLTENQLSNFNKKVTDFAIESGTNINDVYSAVKTYANSREQFSSILGKSKGAIALADASGIDFKSATDAIHSAAVTFHKESKNVEADSMATASRIAKVAAATSIDFSTSVGDKNCRLRQMM